MLLFLPGTTPLHGKTSAGHHGGAAEPLRARSFPTLFVSRVVFYIQAGFNCLPLRSASRLAHQRGARNVMLGEDAQAQAQPLRTGRGRQRLILIADEIRD